MAAKKKSKTTKRSTKVKAKPAPKKSKTPAKKKATKKVADPHKGKRFFKIELGGYGGELIVGKSSEEFVQYWLHKDRKELLMDHMHGMNDMAMYGDDFSDEDEEVERDENEGFDKNSPEVYEGSGNREYWDFDDIEHDTMVSYEYGSYNVTEVTVDPRAEYVDGELRWSDKETRKKTFDWSATMTREIDKVQSYNYDNCVVSRELYVHDTKKGIVDPVPVIMLYDSQKGVFGHLYVMTNGEDFDHKKFAYVALDNTMSNSAEMFYYDKVGLNVDTNELSTWGKGFFASVGYLPKCEVEYDYQAMLAEGWKNLESN
jgi:hypothetical protein